MCHDNEEWCKIERGLHLPVQNWHEDFEKFWPEHLKISQICTLIGCFWPKYIMFELKKVQRSYVWLHWRIMQNLKEKRRLFHLSWQPNALGGNLTMWPLFFDPPRKAFLSPSVWPGREYRGHSIESRAYWFILKIARLFLILTSRNGMMNTFIIVNINPACER